VEITEKQVLLKVGDDTWLTACGVEYSLSP
jgi:hypothetical protein